MRPSGAPSSAAAASSGVSAPRSRSLKTTAAPANAASAPRPASAGAATGAAGRWSLESCGGHGRFLLGRRDRRAGCRPRWPGCTVVLVRPGADPAVRCVRRGPPSGRRVIGRETDLSGAPVALRSRHVRTRDAVARPAALGARRPAGARADARRSGRARRPRRRRARPAAAADRRVRGDDGQPRDPTAAPAHRRGRGGGGPRVPDPARGRARGLGLRRRPDRHLLRRPVRRPAPRRLPRDSSSIVAAIELYPFVADDVSVVDEIANAAIPVVVWVFARLARERLDRAVAGGAGRDGGPGAGARGGAGPGDRAGRRAAADRPRDARRRRPRGDADAAARRRRPGQPRRPGAGDGPRAGRRPHAGRTALADLQRLLRVLRDDSGDDRPTRAGHPRRRRGAGESPRRAAGTSR